MNYLRYNFENEKLKMKGAISSSKDGNPRAYEQSSELY